ncbi:MAG: hypothetical protein WD065_08480 [Planctomycetaceae bacterium]
MTEQNQWLCPHCRIPLRFRDFQPGEQIFPCPDCERPIQILTSGRRITGILALPENNAPTGKTPSSKFPPASWSEAVLAGGVTSPRAISLFVTLALGVVVAGVWMANRPVPIPTAIDDRPQDVVLADNEVPAAEQPAKEDAAVPAHVDDVSDELDPKPADDDSTSGQEIPDETESSPASSDDLGPSEEEPGPTNTPGDETATSQDDAAIASVPYDSPTQEPDAETINARSANPIASSPTPENDINGEADGEKEADAATPTVDVKRALQIKVARWEQARSIPLIEILDQFEEMVGGKIVLDQFDSPDVQKRLTRPISFAHRQKSFAEILTLLLDDAGLKYEIRENKIHVSPARP